MSSFQLQNAEVLARLKPFGILFEKSLTDLIKGIRLHSKESAECLLRFLDDAIMECRNELNTTDLETKAMAVLKLAYLEMYGFEMSWCNFQILEVMSSTKIQQKRIGYLAAMQSFKNEQDLLILATNQFKKDLNSTNHVEIGLALSGIATIVTPSLATDIVDDVLVKLNHSRACIRKKAMLAMYKIFLKYPESLRVNFDRVIDKLDDSDATVINATITVICEISKTNPRIFINYLPKFFQILEETRNNWLTIRLLKLFQSLSKVEPRMKKKIAPSIVNLMLRTQASSLIYECINCIVSGNMLSAESSKDKETAKLCIEQLMKFFETQDPNLKFVGLLALINIIKLFPTYMHKTKGVSEVIMDCLKDDDLIIKQKALEVCHLLVTDKNIVEVVRVLLLQLIPDNNSYLPKTFQLEVIMKILQISRENNYERIPNFRWYVAVLKDIISLTLLPLEDEKEKLSIVDSPNSKEISLALGREFKNLATRVPSIRSEMVNKVVINSLQDVSVFDHSPYLLKDLFWIMGEYISEVCNESDEDSEDENEEYSQVGKVMKDLIDIDGATKEGLGKLIQLFNSLVNNHIDVLCRREDKPRFPISSRLLKLDRPEVLIIVVQALVKLYCEIVIQYLSSYSYDQMIPKERLNELIYFLYKLIKFLSNWENNPHYEVQERTLSWLEFLKLCLEAVPDNNLEAIKKLEQNEISYYSNYDSEESSDSDSEVFEEEPYCDLQSEEDIDDDESGSFNSHKDDQFEKLVYEDDSSKNNHHILNGHQMEIIKKKEYLQIDSDTEDGLSLQKESQENQESGGDEINSNLISKNDASNPYVLLPSLLSTVLPSFFKSYQLLPVAWNAQRNIPIPSDLNVSTEINPSFFHDENLRDDEDDDSYKLYLSENEGDTSDTSEPLISLQSEEEISEKRKKRIERLKDDPYYITSTSKSELPKSRLSKSKKKLQSETKTDKAHALRSVTPSDIVEKNHASAKSKSKKMKKEKVLVLADETVEGNYENSDRKSSGMRPKSTRNVLKIQKINFNDFDFSSGPNSDFLSQNIVDPVDFDIDLEAMRNELAKASEKKLKKETKKKKRGSEKSKHKSETLQTGKDKLPVDPEGEAKGSKTNEAVHVSSAKKKKRKALIYE